jgi:hypothetical protein
VILRNKYQQEIVVYQFCLQTIYALASYCFALPNDCKQIKRVKRKKVEWVS